MSIKNGFFEGQLLSSQSDQFKKLSKISDWVEKSRLSTKATLNKLLELHL